MLQEPVKKPADTQPDVRPKETSAAAAVSKDTPAAAAAAKKAAPVDAPNKDEKDKTIQEKLEEAMQPAFDEMGGKLHIIYLTLLPL